MQNKIRDDALEEAAKLAEKYDKYTVDGRESHCGFVIATAIRQLKSGEPELYDPSKHG